MGGRMVGRYVHPARQKLEKWLGAHLGVRRRLTGWEEQETILDAQGARLETQQSMGAPCWTLSEMPSSESRLRAGRDFWSLER